MPTNIDVKKIYEWPTIAQIMVMGLIGLIVFYLGYMFDLSNFNQELSATADQETQLKQSYESMVKEHVSSVNAVMQLPKLKQLLASWQQRFASTAGVVQLQDKILGLAENNSLKVVSFNPSAEKKAGLYTTVPVKIEITGTFVQTATYISQLANLDKLIVIGNFEIDSVIAGGGAQVQPVNSDNPVDTILNLIIYKY